MTDNGEGAAIPETTFTPIQIPTEKSPQRADNGADGNKTGTQAGRPHSREMKLKKCSPVRVFVKSTKPNGSSTDNNVRTPVKKRRASSKSKSENPPSSEIKLPPSVEKKYLSKAKPAQHITLHMKRKKKGRAGNKKNTKQDSADAKSASSGRNSDFAAFQPDEEIAPWNDMATNSDDTSIMTKTIRNPRILPFHSSQFPTNGGQQANLADWSNKRSRGLPRNSSDHNIDLPPSTSESSASFSRTSISRTDEDDKEKAHMVKSVRCSEKDIAALSEKLIKGIHVKTSVGITANIPSKTLSPTSGVTKQEVYHSHNKDIVKGRPKNVRDKLATSSGLRAGEHTTGTARAGTAKGSADCLKAESKPIHDRSPAFGPREILSIARQNQHHQQHMKVAVAGQRSGSVLRCQQSISQNSQHGKVSRRGNAQNGLSDWFVDIFLICITLFCTCFVLYIHQYRPTNEFVFGT